MKLNLLISAFFLIAVSVHSYAQQKLILENNAVGASREILRLHNKANSSLNAVISSYIAGQDLTGAKGEITMFDNSYSGLAGYQGYFDIHTPDNGLQLRTSQPGGQIRLITGGNTIATNTRLLITDSGEVGIGTIQPKRRLQVSGGDVYVETAASGIILKSPNGACFKVTISDTGVLNPANVPCP